MMTTRRSLAVLELLLVFPAMLFMAALFARSIQPIDYEPARTAQRIIDWYASSVHIGLWLLLIALPLTVLSIGATTLMRAWRRDRTFRDAALQMFSVIRAHAAMLLIACATFASGGILAVVALHLMTD